MRVFSPLVFAASAACAQPLLVQDSPVMRVLTTDNDYGLNQYEAFGVPVDEADFEDGENDFNHGENDYDGRNGNLHYDVAEGGQDDADFADFSLAHPAPAIALPSTEGKPSNGVENYVIKKSDDDDDDDDDDYDEADLHGEEIHIARLHPSTSVAHSKLHGVPSMQLHMLNHAPAHVPR
ncbi:hypothetical protein DYB32_003167 [Aphanomyces invadans]|uniref:RxLR effector protein n=1 Tax=Aphanomyces invadans TaxID=157072 RepID=A0A3R6Z7H8_9STRA|nr:hypothetical protein DYB32_003167 [Aphanomyces invadans]